KSDVAQVKQIVSAIKQQQNRLITMAIDQAAFDQQLAQTVTQVVDLVSDVATQTQSINTTVQAIIDKIAQSGGQPVDLSAEAAQLTSMQDGLTNAKASLDQIASGLPTAPTPPPTPTAKK